MQELSKELREHYVAYNPYIDPKEGKTLFEQLSNSPTEIPLQLFSLLKQDTRNFGRRVNNGPWTVSSILQPLLADQLISFPLTDQHYAAVYLSALRTKKIPSRMRCHFIESGRGMYKGTWVCEIYDFQSNRWYKVDPTNQTMLISNSTSKTTSEMYLTLLSQKTLSNQVSYRHWTGMLAAKQALLDDINCIISKELLQEEWMSNPKTEEKPILYRKPIQSLEPSEEEILYRVAIMMIAPEDNYDLIEDMHDKYLLKK